MKILAIGDPHGSLPNNLNDICENNKIDFIFCPGDFGESKKVRDLYFKYWEETRDYDNFIKTLTGKWFSLNMKMAGKYRDKSAYKILDKLNSIGLPVVVTHGNHDSHKKWMVKKGNSTEKQFYIEDKIKELSNVRMLDCSGYNYEGYYICGVGSKLRGVDLSGKLTPAKKRIKDSYMKKMQKLLSRKKNIIFLTHEPPMNTKLDRISDKSSPRYGDHVGDHVINLAIKKYKPIVNIHGHIHESRGSIMLSKTKCINTGVHGQYSIVTIKDKKVSVKFY